MNEDLIDIVIGITKNCIFYKDDEIVKACRKALAECEENVRKDSLHKSVSKFVSFIRQYPVVDLVTPLKKD